MKNKAIVANIGHFDNEIDMAGLGRVPGITKTEIKPQAVSYTHLDVYKRQEWTRSYAAVAAATFLSPKAPGKCWRTASRRAGR